MRHEESPLAAAMRVEDRGERLIAVTPEWRAAYRGTHYPTDPHEDCYWNAAAAALDRFPTYAAFWRHFDAVPIVARGHGPGDSFEVHPNAYSAAQLREATAVLAAYAERKAS